MSGERKQTIGNRNASELEEQNIPESAKILLRNLLHDLPNIQFCVVAVLENLRSGILPEIGDMKYARDLLGNWEKMLSR